MRIDYWKLRDSQQHNSGFHGFTAILGNSCLISNDLAENWFKNCEYLRKIRYFFKKEKTAPTFEYTDSFNSHQQWLNESASKINQYSKIYNNYM